MKCLGVAEDSSRCQDMQWRWLWQGEWQDYVMALEVQALDTLQKVENIMTLMRQIKEVVCREYWKEEGF